MGRKSRLKREWRKKHPGGWKQYLQEHKPTSWSFADGLACFDPPEGMSLFGSVLCFAVVSVVTLALDVARLFRRPLTPRQ
jgi:hypothetical protein